MFNEFLAEHPANADTTGKVEALERSVLDLIPLFASWKDSLARVNRLPPEVLTRIAQFLSNRELYAGLRVCRYWHNVLMSPELWSDIDLDQVEAAQIFLSRSKGVPVDVRSTRSHKEIQLTILSTCPSRIRSLNISLGAVSWHLLTNFSNTPAPLMRHLRIACGRRTGCSQLPSTLFTGNLPSLRSLVLFNISSDFTHLVLPNLTTFELRGVTDSDVALSLSSLLDFLERSPLLESLHFNYHSNYDDTVAPKRVITLHRAKSIHISGRPLTPTDTSRGLLAHLLLPSGVAVDLEVYIHGSDTDVVARAIPLHYDLIPCTKSPKRISFQRVTSSGCLIAFTGENGFFRIFANWEEIDEDFASQAICSFGSLDVSGVDTLVVHNYGDTHQYYTQALRNLSNLRSLAVSCCDNGAAVLYALRQEGTSPRLQHFAMDIVDAGSVHVDDLLEVAKVRKLRDQKLETLRVGLLSRGNLVGSISSLQEYVESLEIPRALEPGDSFRSRF